MILSLLEPSLPDKTCKNCNTSILSSENVSQQFLTGSQLAIYIHLCMCVFGSMAMPWLLLCLSSDYGCYRHGNLWHISLQ